MAILSTLLFYAAPLFLIVSPVTSYMDQILSMHRSRSSSGFSLDIPLIMLTASIIKIFYWPGARFDSALLLQAIIMLAVQSLLLRVALSNRVTPLRPEAFEMKPGSSHGKGLGIGGAGGLTAEYGKGYSSSGGSSPAWLPRSSSLEKNKKVSNRPFDFWRWREESIYWQYVMILAAVLGTMHILIRPAPGRAEDYTNVLGAVGLGIEALVPIPQLWQNYSSQSCRGFRLSVIVNWLFGDAMKMGFFFMSEPGMIPWSFKACGVFQAACDVGLGLQYWMYGEGLDYDIEGHYA